VCNLSGQEVLKDDIRSEVKSDISKVRVDLITQVHALEKQMGSYISANMEELGTQISDLCFGKA
jgi:hypothetical protein